MRPHVLSRLRPPRPRITPRPGAFLHTGERLLAWSGERLVAWCLGCVLLACGGPGTAAAADAEAAREHFEKAIRPVLVRECIRCHGPEKQQGGLRLDSRQGWADGGDSGAAIVPGDPPASLLIEAMRYEGYEMPPRGKLDDKTLAAFETWVAQGAFDPREGAGLDGEEGPPTVAEGKTFWAFQPPRAPAVPDVG